MPDAREGGARHAEGGRDVAAPGTWREGVSGLSVPLWRLAPDVTAPAEVAKDGVVIAAEVHDALHTRWPDSEYLTIPEAPDGPSRQGCKIDLLVVSLWASRHFELDAVEIKVSLHDWRRELANPNKSWFWRKHANRFWVAVPVALVSTVRQELPPGWGLLACASAGAQRTATVVQPVTTPADPLTWPQTVGLLRATADCGFGALLRAEERGYRAGRKAAEDEAALANTMGEVG